MSSKVSYAPENPVEATVTSKGQVTLPKALRNHLGIQTGSRIRFSVAAEGGFQASHVLYELEDLWKMADKGGQSGAVMTFEEMDDAKAREKLVIVADTNLWARAYLNDDASQARKARKALAEARSKGGVFVPLIVLAELAWVLRGRWERDRILSTLESLLQTRGVTVESPAVALKALKATREGQAGFADQLIAQVGFANGATEVITFDDKFSRSPKVRRIK